jgi:hypothetical protein
LFKLLILDMLSAPSRVFSPVSGRPSPAAVPALDNKAIHPSFLPNVGYAALRNEVFPGIRQMRNEYLAAIPTWSSDISRFCATSLHSNSAIGLAQASLTTF